FRFVKANAAFCNMLGYTEEEILRLTAADITHPDDVSRELPLVEEMFQGVRDRYELETRFLTKSGDILWTTLRMGMIRADNGTPLYGVGVIENITERKQADAALQASEERFRVLVEQSSDIIFLVEADTTIIYTSPSLTRVTGYTP